MHHKHVWHAGDTSALGGIPTRHAAELTYEAFVREYMAPNLPVMIKVRHLNGAAAAIVALLNTVAAAQVH